MEQDQNATNLAAIRATLGYILALLVAILVAVIVGSWAVYRAVGFPGESVF